MLNPLYMKHRPSTQLSIGPPSSPPSLHNLKEIEELREVILKEEFIENFLLTYCGMNIRHGRQRSISTTRIDTIIDLFFVSAESQKISDIFVLESSQ
ncbi:hypothetical protein DICVIV_09264 [Dictyocaulus viviparus]|uniref:Uncharacterized protein n=1 Tax=Dictyocaulus viviparus TaxID=29172 RepID=A0A0D8XLU6_DICVI|nr:hypothetical protein DICVIV_09264 [Dictyocaulus viviparus]